MFGSILLFVTTVMHGYVFWRLYTIPFVKNHVPRYLLIGSCIALWAIFLTSRMIGHGGTGTLPAVLDQLGITWMAILFLISVPLVATDIITGFGFVFSRFAPMLRGCALVMGCVLCMVAFVQGHRAPVIQYYEVQLSGLPSQMDGKTLVAMSDMHLGTLLGKAWLEKRVAQVQTLRPDMVVLLGDVFEGHGKPQPELLKILNRISAPLGVWAVAGNHEFHSGAGETMDMVQKSGLHVLHNRWTEVHHGLLLAGVDDLTAWQRDGRKEDPMQKALGAKPVGATILLSHTPWKAEEAARLGAGLMLSGHTHSGQIWPFGYLVGWRYPLLEGLYDVNGMKVIVCRGTGTWGTRMRLWHPSEILQIKLRSGK